MVPLHGDWEAAVRMETVFCNFARTTHACPSQLTQQPILNLVRKVLDPKVSRNSTVQYLPGENQAKAKLTTPPPPPKTSRTCTLMLPPHEERIASPYVQGLGVAPQQSGKVAQNCFIH